MRALIIQQNVETISEQSPYFSKFISQKNQFTFSGKRTRFSELRHKTNSAFIVHSTPREFSTQFLDKGQPHFHVLIEVTKDCNDAVNKMTSKPFILLCLLSSFKFLIMNCSKYHLPGLLTIFVQKMILREKKISD